MSTMPTYDSICKMSYDEWLASIQSLHTATLNIQLQAIPNHQDLTSQLALVDRTKTILSLFKTVIDTQASLLEGLYKNAKREVAEGKNEAERMANAIARCRNYVVSGEMMKRIFMYEPTPANIDLVDVVEKTRARKVMIDDVYHTLSDKAQSLTMQSSVVKDSNEVLRFGKQ